MGLKVTGHTVSIYKDSNLSFISPLLQDPKAKTTYPFPGTPLSKIKLPVEKKFFTNLEAVEPRNRGVAVIAVVAVGSVGGYSEAD